MKPPKSRAPEPEQDEEIPDWIKAIGAGAIASQAFDREDKQEETRPSQPVGQEETTQWLNSQGTAGTTAEDSLSSEFAWLGNPDQAEGLPPGGQDEQPEWLKGLGLGEPVPPASQEEPDWLKGLNKTEEPRSDSEDLDWLKELDASETAPSVPAADEPDWLKGLVGTEATPATSQTEDPDWLKGLGGREPEATTPQEDELDWLKGLGETEAEPAVSQSDGPDWLKGLADKEAEPSAAVSDEPDWLKGLGEPATPPAAEQEEPDWLKGLGEPKSMPSSASEDKPDWLKGLAFAGGAGAIAALAHEESEEEKETPVVPTPAEGEADFLNQLTEEPILTPGPESTPSAVNPDQLGTSEQEQDDSFAWLESLAAKQGATEGLLTKPEDRLEEEPEWVKQAKGLKSEPQVPQPPIEQPAASVEDLGKSSQDQDDAFAWLESLAAKQGATEGLLTKPEDRLEEEPEWVKQAKDLNVSHEPAADQTEDLDWMKGMAVAGGAAAVSHFTGRDESDETQETTELEQPLQISEPGPGALSEPLPAAEQPGQVDDVEAWLKNLEGEETAEPAAAVDETAIWLKGLEEEEPSRAEEKPVETPASDLPDWMQNVQVEPEETSPVIFAEEAELSATWMPPVEEPRPRPNRKPTRMPFRAGWESWWMSRKRPPRLQKLTISRPGCWQRKLHLLRLSRPASPIGNGWKGAAGGARSGTAPCCSL